jgi:CRP-like cAMP-binding protein
MDNDFNILFRTIEKKTLLDKTDKELIKRTFRPLKIKKGGFFLKAGDIPDRIAFIVKGIFRYYYIDYDGNHSTKYFSTENSFLISYSAMIQKKRRIIL